MLTLHYNSSNGYPSNGSDNGGGSSYLDYTTLTNMSTDRLTESSKSPLVGGHSIEGAGSSAAGDSGTGYGYFENLDSSAGGGGANYGHSPVGSYSQGGTSKTPNYEYTIQSGSQASTAADGYSTSAEPVSLGGHSLLPPMHHQISVTIGPGTSQQRTLPVIYDQMQLSKDTYGAFLSIVEQPTNRIRYRYRSEKGSHGGLNGENSSQLKKTYPTIKVENYRQSSAIYIRASLATNENKPKAHVHKLMGRHCSEDGACTLPVAENFTTIFQNLGILFIGKKEVPEILYKRKLTDFQSRYFNQTLTEKVRESLREQSEKEAKDMNLNSVKICFEAFVLQNEALYPICSPVYSRPIANQKSPDSGELKIIRINRYCGTVAGGDEVYLLCEKVNKKEIRVRFFEVDSEGNQQWEAFGHFNESDVHHQVAIVFRTPPYRDQSIGKPTQVYLQLYRQRDGEFSEPRTFIYKPKGDTSSDFSGEVLLSSKSGLQECVLTRIRLENQPPGYKRRKYSHQNGGSAKLGKSGGGSGGGGRGGSTLSSENNSGAHSAGTSYLQRKGANKHARVQVKVQSAPQEVTTIKTEHDQEICPLNSSNNSSAAAGSSSFAGAGQGGHMEGSFCHAPLPLKSSFSVGANKCSTSHFSTLGRPPMASASLSLPSPTSHSCSSSTPSSPTSATSLMLSTALQQTVLVDQTTVSNSSNNHNHNQHQQQQQQQPPQHSDSLDFDHLDSMWTPPSEPSPPLSAGDFFHSFLPMSTAPPSAAAAVAAASVHSLANGSHQAVTFVDLSNNNIDHHHHHHHHHHQQQQHPHLQQLDGQQLSIVSLDVATAPSISLSPPLSTPSPSIVSSNSCTSIQQQQQQQSYSGSICMLYS